MTLQYFTLRHSDSMVNSDTWQRVLQTQQSIVHDGERLQPAVGKASVAASERIT